MKDFLTSLLNSRLAPDRRAWLARAQEMLADPAQKARASEYYAAASRKLGKQALLLDHREREQLRALSPLLPLDHWGVDEAARAVLLLALTDLPAGQFAETAVECYEVGDSREQQSWLRGLSLLPGCKRFLSTAIDGCRTNIVPLFESIACENPYPCLYFPDLNFDQMVLKSLFNGIAISRIVGLESRFNAELSRMADDYASEREAAGRQVPIDIWLVVAPRIPAPRLDRVFRYLHHENPQHRYWAAVGMGHTGSGAGRTELEKRRSIESEPEVLRAIETSLERLAR
ncbi:MAG: EboA domain-containing protein [Acidobacteriota bacterium]